MKTFISLWPEKFGGSYSKTTSSTLWCPISLAWVYSLCAFWSVVVVCLYRTSSNLQDVMWGEVWFYYSHWWVHHTPKRMNLVHKRHHEFNRYLYAMVGFYCSPWEMIVVNLPLSLGFGVIALVHPYVLSTWLFILAAHCKQPLLPLVATQIVGQSSLSYHSS